MKNQSFDIIIIGGSYSGLSAAMALGRARRKVLIIDSGKPCNQQTPHSHNFITHDGSTPAQIASLAKKQTLAYKTIEWHNGLALFGQKTKNGYEIKTESGELFYAKKLLFATGVKDIMPNIDGFAACWGISVIHCPYCHGYEYSEQKTGILANGDMGFEMCKLISNWTKELSLFTNGASTLTKEQTEKLKQHSIHIEEKEIASLVHEQGYLRNIVFEDGTKQEIKAMYARPVFEQHCPIPQQLGCELTEMKHLKVDMFQKTSVQGVYASGDNTSPMRSVSNAVATGNVAGAVINKELIDEYF